MKEQDVTITDSRIYYSEDDTKIVMDIVSKELMEVYSNIVTQNNGKTLDVGFGLGYSADSIYNKVGNYHCIECNPQIYQKALKWAKNKENVHIYFGDWVDVILELSKNGTKFDGIFMDTYEDPNYSSFEKYAKLISNENCVLSIFSYFTNRDVKETHSHYFEIKSKYRKDYPKIIEKGHACNWTYFIDGEFIIKEKCNLV